MADCKRQPDDARPGIIWLPLAVGRFFRSGFEPAASDQYPIDPLGAFMVQLVKTASPINLLETNHMILYIYNLLNYPLAINDTPHQVV